MIDRHDKKVDKSAFDGPLVWIQTFSLLTFFLGIAVCWIGLWISGLAICVIGVIVYLALYSLMDELDEKAKAKKRAKLNESPK